MTTELKRVCAADSESPLIDSQRPGRGMPMEQYEASRSCFHIKHKADRSDVYPPR